MIRLSAVANSGAALVSGISLSLVSLAPAPALAAMPQPIPIEKIEGLCPSIGTTGLSFGVARDGQDSASLDVLMQESGERAPFVEGAANFTPWSDKLTGVTWYASQEEENAKPEEWLDHMAVTLEKGGWVQESPGTERGFTEYLPVTFHKDFSIADAQKTLEIKVSAFGNYELTCSDPYLVLLSENEGLGALEPGSPRPVLADVGMAALPDPATCERPEVQDMFSTSEKLEAAGHRVDELIPVADRDGEVARHGERLRTWLAWKLSESGKVDQQRLWEIEESAVPSADEDHLEDMMGFLADATEMIDAQKVGDGATVCRGMIAMFAKKRLADAAEADRWAKINAALEAEAVKLGIPLE